MRTAALPCLVDFFLNQTGCGVWAGSSRVGVLITGLPWMGGELQGSENPGNLAVGFRLSRVCILWTDCLYSFKFYRFIRELLTQQDIWAFLHWSKISSRNPSVMVLSDGCEKYHVVPVNILLLPLWPEKAWDSPLSLVMWPQASCTAPCDNFPPAELSSSNHIWLHTCYFTGTAVSTFGQLSHFSPHDDPVKEALLLPLF